MLHLVSLILIRWIVICLAPVVQKVDNATHGMDEISIHWIAQLVYPEYLTSAG